MKILSRFPFFSFSYIRNDFLAIFKYLLRSGGKRKSAVNMVSVITPSICFVILSLLDFGYTGKKTEKIILHVPFQIIHHHHADYVPIPIKKVPKKPEGTKIEDIKPVTEEVEPIKYEESTKNEQQEQKPREQKEQKPLKLKRMKLKWKPTISSTPTPIPLESFLGLDQIFKDAQIYPEPIPLQTKNKFPKIVQQSKDYQFSDGTSYYDIRKPQQQPSASYMFTSMDHSKPIPHHIPKAKGRSEVKFADDSEYEHVGYIVFGDKIHE